ncbi:MULTISPECIES: hypothetical protein [Amycolatopsis]|uniref:hypothetical protein n=1 Tax=Amycolatopsis TaxID=1813 RepID=UPI000AC37CD8|nr:MULTISPECIES: hypothetical protein [Amycolatopsis]
MTDNQQAALPSVRRYGGASIETLAVAPLLGDGYSYDKATLHEIATEFENLADAYKMDQLSIDIISRTQPPGLDRSSDENATTFGRSGIALLNSLRQCEKYCRDQAAKYRAALDRYGVTEDAHSTDLHRTGGSL